MGSITDTNRKTYYMSHPSFSFLYLLLLFAISGSSSLQAVYAQNSIPWKMFRQNVENTGFSPFQGPRFPDPLWQFNTSGFTYSSPTIGDDAIYIASEEELIALDLDGTERWSIELSQDVNIEGIEISGIVSTPAVSNTGVIYVGSLDNGLYAISPSGIVLWRHDTGGQVFSSPTIGPDGTIYVGSRSGGIFALTPNNTIRWVNDLPGEIFSSPALDPENNVLYVGSTDNVLYALDMTTGNIQWFSQNLIQEEIVSSPAVSNGVVYVGSVDNNLYAFDALTGQFLWSFNAADIFVASPAINPNNNTLYIGSFDGSFYAIDTNTGLQKWSFNVDNIIASSAAVDATGLIYLTSLDGTIYVLRDDGSQPAILWTYSLGAPIWASPSISPGNIMYVAASGSNARPGTLLAIGESLYEVALNPAIPIAGENLSISVRLTGNSAPVPVDLYYRSARDADFTVIPLTDGVVIPGSAITEDGFAYYVEGAAGTFPAVSPASQPATRPVFSQRITTDAELFPRRYKMVSVPFDLNDPSILSVLDEYGAYDPLNWRLLRWDGDAYREFPDLGAAFTPGTALFLVTTTGAPFDVINATSVDTSNPYTIELAPGWNQIGTPFGFPVAWNRVIRNTEVVNAIAFYDGVEMIQDPEIVRNLQPWEGYFVFNAGDEVTGIQIPPIPIVDENVVGEEEAGKQVAAARLQIIATLDGTDLRDSQNWVGFHAAARDAEDPMDMLEAPPFGEEFVRLSVGTSATPYALNYKSVTTQGQEWPLSLSLSNPNLARNSGTITLSFVEDAGFPKNFDIAIVDERYGIVQPVVNGTTTLTWDAGQDMRNLRLIVGTAAYLDAVVGDLPLAPNQPSLAQNFPNPFVSSTSIQYQLTKRSAVSLTVYNALGQEVLTLVDATQNPGTYQTVWEGKDNNGQQAPSGVYFYRLVAENFHASGQMTLIR